MDIHVLYDRSGKILAAVELREEAEKGGGVPLPRPEPQRGQRTADVRVPEEFRDLSFLEACTQLVVAQARGERAMLVRKKRQARQASRKMRQPPKQKARTSVGRPPGRTKRP
jgi:hypothetical protein